MMLNADSAVAPPQLNRGMTQPGPAVSEHDLINHVLEFCAAAGYTIPPLLVIDYVVALRSSPFVLLFGPSGQGKTELARLLAQALVSPFDEQYIYVNLGIASEGTSFVHLQDRFGWLKFVEILETAATSANAHRVFFLCLDNLRPADVMTYFSMLVHGSDNIQRLAIRGYPADYWPSVPDNVIITGTLDAAQPIDAEQSTLLAQINCVYVQPQWLQASIQTVSTHQRMAPIGFQRLLLQHTLRSDEAVGTRLRTLLGDDLEEFWQPPAELAAIMWQAGLTYDEAWRSAMLRSVANSFTHTGQGVFVPDDVVTNAHFALVFALTRQMMLRLWEHKQYQRQLEQILKYHLDQLPPVSSFSTTATLYY
ncbi:MAG: ATP-binding protein [Herpetosiphonaceae bacterium]|nr:ATP-binding protein [Herpetosiphonaceae bacterium]